MISTNQERWPFPVPPLGALAVAAAAEASGHRVELLDLIFARSPRRALRLVLKGQRYDAVGGACSCHGLLGLYWRRVGS